MLHFEYLKPGSSVVLPELAGYIDGQIADFEVVSVHPGGMGVCIRIRPKGTQDDYGLKCIRPDLLTGVDAFDRFHDELEVWLAASACSAVAEAIAVTRINDLPVVLSPWMRGGDLAGALPDLAPSQKIQAVLRIIRGLKWVYGNLNVIHRDLKPGNILIDSDGLAYVADWGLARPANASRRNSISEKHSSKIERPDRTQAGSFLGTVMYSAPEQLIDARSVDHRADIYALGCIMYEMEMGAPPFSGASAHVVAQKHLKENTAESWRIIQENRSRPRKNHCQMSSQATRGSI